MPFHARAYVSELTQFLQTLKAQSALEEKQVQGRLRLWDKPPQDAQLRTGFERSRVPQRAYVYGNHSGWPLRHG